jgi:hypothetical protein
MKNRTLMKNYVKLFIISFLVSFSVTLSANPTNNKVIKSTRLNPRDKSTYDQVMAPKLLLSEMKKALEGSQNSARLVTLHYSASSISYNPLIVRKNMELSERWNLIGAENGNVGAMLEAASWLSENHGKLGCSRALFWLNRAMSMGRIKKDAYSSSDRRDYAYVIELQSKIILSLGSKNSKGAENICNDLTLSK